MADNKSFYDQNDDKSMFNPWTIGRTNPNSPEPYSAQDSSVSEAPDRVDGLADTNSIRRRVTPNQFQSDAAPSESHSKINPLRSDTNAENTNGIPLHAPQSETIKIPITQTFKELRDDVWTAFRPNIHADYEFRVMNIALCSLNPNRAAFYAWSGCWGLTATHRFYFMAKTFASIKDPINRPKVYDSALKELTTDIDASLYGFMIFGCSFLATTDEKGLTALRILTGIFAGLILVASLCLITCLKFSMRGRNRAVESDSA